MYAILTGTILCKATYIAMRFGEPPQFDNPGPCRRYVGDSTWASCLSDAVIHIVPLVSRQRRLLLSKTMASSNDPIINADTININGTLNICRDQFNNHQPPDRERNDLYTIEYTTDLQSQQVLQTVENWETGYPLSISR